MNGRYILDENGRPVPEPGLLTWGAWMETAHRHVAHTHIADTIFVSTVFLGLDHSFGSGPPLLYETMVFGGPLDQDQVRYCTSEEAREGHIEMVERVMEALRSLPRPE